MHDAQCIMGMLKVRIVKTAPEGATAGSGGMNCQIPGCAATVSVIASSTGGIRPGGLTEPYCGS